VYETAHGLCGTGNITLYYQQKVIKGDPNDNLGAPVGFASLDMTLGGWSRHLALGLKPGHQYWFDFEENSAGIGGFVEQGSDVDVKALNSWEKKSFPNDTTSFTVWKPSQSFSAITTSLPSHPTIKTSINLTAFPNGAISKGLTDNWVRLVKGDDNKCRVQFWTHSCKQLSDVVGDYRNGKCQSGGFQFDIPLLKVITNANLVFPWQSALGLCGNGWVTMIYGRDNTWPVGSLAFHLPLSDTSSVEAQIPIRFVPCQSWYDAQKDKNFVDSRCHPNVEDFNRWKIVTVWKA
jgi:hypothetical protein